MHRWVPSQRRTTKPRRPAKVGKRVSSESAGFPPLLGSGIRRLRKFPLAGERDSPAGVTGERDFRPGPRRSYRGAEFSPAEVAGSGVFPRRGQVQGVKGHSILHCTPWLAGILRSVDSICWQGADLEAVAFSCTGRRLARAANGLGFSVQGLGFSVQGLGFSVQGLGFSVQGLGFRVQGLGFSVQGLGFSVQGLGFSVQGLGFSVQGLGFRVQGLGLSV